MAFALVNILGFLFIAVVLVLLVIIWRKKGRKKGLIGIGLLLGSLVLLSLVVVLSGLNLESMSFVAIRLVFWILWSAGLFLYLNKKGIATS